MLRPFIETRLGGLFPDAEKCACDRIFSSQDLANRHHEDDHLPYLDSHLTAVEPWADIVNLAGHSFSWDDSQLPASTLNQSRGPSRKTESCQA